MHLNSLVSVLLLSVFISEERLMKAPEGYREERGNKLRQQVGAHVRACVNTVLWLHIPTCQSLPAMHYLNTRAVHHLHLYSFNM